MKEISNLEKTSDNHRKCLRPSEILKSNKIVLQIITCLKTEFSSPFDEEYDNDKLYNIVSGRAVPENISDSLMNIDTIGRNYFKEFELRMVSNQEKAFFDPIKRKNQPTIKSSEKKIKVMNISIQEVKIERDVLGTLLALGVKERQTIDIDKALRYPLSPVCLPLYTANGNRRKTTKSDLYIAFDGMEADADEAHRNCKSYFIDLAAYVRTVVSHCNTVRDIATSLIKSIPMNYETLYIICDIYEKESIKASERHLRGDGERFILKNPDMKLPCNINNFLSLGENKEDLFQLIQRIMKENVRSKKIFFCFQNCIQIDSSDETTRPDLICDREEADTKLIAYAKQVTNGGIMVGSPSGDIDIVVLFVHHFVTELGHLEK